jgi:hypothetical protein
MSCFKTKALIHLIQALGPISHNIFTTELNVHAKNFIKDLVCINKLDNKHTMKKFQTKSLDYQQASLVKITHAGENLKQKICALLNSRGFTILLVLKNHISPCLLAFLLPVLLKTCRLPKTKKKNPSGSFTFTFHLPIQKFLLTCILPEITIFF